MFRQITVSLRVMVTPTWRRTPFDPREARSAKRINSL
jgi:hypothetical protein